MLNQEALFPMPQNERTSDDYWTPKWIFDALNIEFDLDVACPPEGPAHTPCKAYYTQETNGLVSPWFGNVFMNPPYSKATAWVHKFIEHGNGIALLPMAKSEWFNVLWDVVPAVMVLPKKTLFEHSANLSGSIFLPVILAAYGPHNVEALHCSNIGRVRC